MAGALSVTKRSYPMSEVRGSSLECQAVMAQERLRGATRGQGRQLRGATPRPRPGTVAGKSYLASKVRGWRPRPGEAAGRRNPTSEVRGGGREESPCVQGQGWRPRPGVGAGSSNPRSIEWWLCRRRRV